MKRILFFLLLLPAFSFAQLCADEDTVRANSVTLITYNSARVNGTTGHFAGTVLSISLKYVRVGQTDTATSTSAGVNALRNITGLQANTLYVYYYISTCGSGTVKQSVAYTFTTLANTVNYTPMAAMGYQFKYLKADSGLMAPRRDTTIGRAPDYGGQIVWKPEDSTFYGYNGEYWHPLAIDSAGIISLLNDKVDSVTVAGDSLWYWKSGVSYGYILPTQANEWKLVGNSGTTAGTNFVGTTDNVDLVFKRNSVESGRFSASGNLNLGLTGTTLGSLGLSGNTSGLITVKGQAAAGTYNFNLPQTAGTSGYLLTSAGGGASPMTWTNPSSLIPTWAETMDAPGGTDLGGNIYNITNTGGEFRMDAAAIEFMGSVELDGLGSFVSVLSDSINIEPSNGVLIIDTLNYSANADDSMIVWRPSTGRVGMRAIPSGGATAWNAISSPTADQALTFDAGESSTWTDANTTEDLFTVNSSTGTTNSMFSLNRTGTALASGNNILELVSSGANGTNAITATGARISVTNTNATSGTNVGLAVTASGATTANYAIQATGAVVPGTNNASDLGTSALAWRTGYFGTSVFSPLIVGGTGTTSDLNLKTTSGVGASGADMHFLVGNNGATEAMTILNNGAVGVNTTTPGVVNGTTFASVKMQVSNAAASTYLTANTDLAAGVAGFLFNRSAASANLRLWSVDSQPDLTNTSSKLTISTYTDAGSPTPIASWDRNAIMGLKMPAVTTQYDNTTTTLGNVTGLTYNVTAAKKYMFEARLYTTSDVAGGIKVAIGGTATATSIIYEGLTTDAGLTTQGRATALGTAVAGVTAVTAAFVTITGVIVVNASGTLTVQAAANAATGTTSVLVGSTFQITEIL